MAPETLEWLKNEAYSNYLVFGAGLAVGLGVALFKRFFRKRAVIEVARVRQAAMVSYSPEIAHNLQITYRDKQVSHLFGSTITFRNRGMETIHDIQISLVMDAQEAELSFIEFHALEDANPKRRAAIVVKARQEGPTLHIAEVSIPYLNAYAEHNDLVTMNIFTDSEFLVSKVSGAGAGWSSRFIDKYLIWKEFEIEIGNNTSIINAVIASMRVVFKRMS